MILPRSDLYELCASGTARHFGPLRRGGGDTSALAAASDATVVAPNNAGTQRIEANGAIRPIAAALVTPLGRMDVEGPRNLAEAGYGVAVGAKGESTSTSR